MSDPIGDSDSWEGDSGQAAGSSAGLGFDVPDVSPGTMLNQGVPGTTVRPGDEPIPGAELNGFSAEMDPGQVASTNAALGALPGSLTAGLRDEVGRLNSSQPQQDGPAFTANPLGADKEDWESRLDNVGTPADDIARTGFGGTNLGGGNDVWKNGFGGTAAAGDAGNDVWQNGFSGASSGPGLPMATPYDAGNGTPGGGAAPGAQMGGPPDMPPAVANVGDTAADDAEAAWNAASSDPVYSGPPLDAADTSTATGSSVTTPNAPSQGAAALPNVPLPSTDVGGADTGGGTNGGATSVGAAAGATNGGAAAASRGPDTSGTTAGLPNGSPSWDSQDNAAGNDVWKNGFGGTAASGDVGNDVWKNGFGGGGGGATPQKKPPPRNFVNVVRMSGYLAASLTWVDDSLISAVQGGAVGPQAGLMSATVALFGNTVVAGGPSPVGSRSTPASDLVFGTEGAGPAQQFAGNSPGWFFSAVDSWAAANPPPQAQAQQASDGSGDGTPGATTYTYADAEGSDGDGGDDSGGGD